MSEFVFSRDIAFATIGYLSVLSGVLIWLFASRQTILDRSVGNAIRIAIRMSLVVACLFYACWLAGLTIVFVILGILLLVGIGFAIDLPVSGVFGFAILYVVQQFVLGFPDRHEWMLDPAKSTTLPDVSPDLRSELIGSRGVTCSPLRPMGEVRIEGESFRAKTTNGQMLGVGEEIVVTGTHHGTLIVRMPTRP
ncbi:MAG: NfeD family protein [Pirellulaceae bacterium]